jgi:hypothetical protein
MKPKRSLKTCNDRDPARRSRFRGGGLASILLHARVQAVEFATKRQQGVAARSSSERPKHTWAVAAEAGQPDSPGWERVEELEMSERELRVQELEVEAALVGVESQG